MEWPAHLGAATSVLAAAVVLAGCSYGPATPPMAETSSVSASASTGPAAVSILPGMAQLGTALTAKGATITPKSDNLTVVRQPTSSELEVGIEVSLTGVTAPIDVTGPNGGFQLYVSSGEHIPTATPTVLTSPPLVSPVSADADGWVFFHLRPDMLPTQLALTAAPAGYGLTPQSIAIWIMPAKLPAPGLPPAPPAPPPPPGAPPAEPAPAPAPADPGGGGGNDGNRGGFHPRLPPPPKMPQLPSPQVPPVICRHTGLC
jgi:hypothetical protein